MCVCSVMCNSALYTTDRSMGSHSMKRLTLAGSCALHCSGRYRLTSTTPLSTSKLMLYIDWMLNYRRVWCLLTDTFDLDCISLVNLIFILLLTCYDTEDLRRCVCCVCVYCVCILRVWFIVKALQRDFCHFAALSFTAVI